MTHSYECRVSLHICDMCDMTHSYECRDSPHMCDMCDMTHSYECRVSLQMCDMCDMTHVYECRDSSHMCSIHVCDMAHWYVWHGTLICVWHGTLICVWHGTLICVWHGTLICVWHDSIHTWDTTHSYVCHSSIIHVTQFIHVCDTTRWMYDTTHSRVWHDSLLCVWQKLFRSAMSLTRQPQDTSLWDEIQSISMNVCHRKNSIMYFIDALHVFHRWNTCIFIKFCWWKTQVFLTESNLW